MSENPQDEKPKFVFPTSMIGHIAKPLKKPTPFQKLKKARVSLEGKVGSVVDARNYRGTDAPNGHWRWPFGQMGGNEFIGFIYLIYDSNNEKLYLGKKQYRSKGKLTKGVTSNWPWYISSSKELSESVKLRRKQGFKFYCIEEYKTLGALSFAETWSLCFVESPSNRDLWYNTLINKVSWPVKEKITDRHKHRLQLLIKELTGARGVQEIQNVL